MDNNSKISTPDLSKFISNFSGFSNRSPSALPDDGKPWAETIRRENGLIEHICKCGVGHPAMGSVDYLGKITGSKGHGVHGCCGCCQSAEWQMADLWEGLQKANDIIIAFKRKTQAMIDKLVKEKIELVNEREKALAKVSEVEKTACEKLAATIKEIEKKNQENIAALLIDDQEF